MFNTNALALTAAIVTVSTTVLSPSITGAAENEFLPKESHEEVVWVPLSYARVLAQTGMIISTSSGHTPDGYVKRFKFRRVRLENSESEVKGKRMVRAVLGKQSDWINAYDSQIRQQWSASWYRARDYGAQAWAVYSVLPPLRSLISVTRSNQRRAAYLKQWHKLCADYRELRATYNAEIAFMNTIRPWHIASTQQQSAGDDTYKPRATLKELPSIMTTSPSPKLDEN